jgi:hypothetical protein
MSCIEKKYMLVTYVGLEPDDMDEEDLNLTYEQALEREESEERINPDYIYKIKEMDDG